MFVILWLVLFVPTIYSNEILNLFSSSLEAFDVIKRTISPVEFIDQSVNEDSRLTTPELITKYGYTAEIHRVTTEDGYELTLHRIAGSTRSPPKSGKTVCFLQHGIFDSSATWVLSGADHGLGYRLADEGFDVWLGNSRGNFYSTNPINYFNSIPRILPQFGKSFWQFSWHEIGFYDLPASIDYVLQTTGKPKLHYVGHSQGTTAFFVMASERPEYNEKIVTMHALAPVAFMTNVKSIPVRIIEPFRSTLQLVTSILGWNFIPPNPSKLSLIRSLPFSILPIQISSIQKAFEQILPAVMGNSNDQLNSTLIPVIQGHTPAGCSVQQLLHYGQLMRTGRFQQFDPDFYDKIEAVKNVASAPDYNLKNIYTPIALYYSDNDWLAGSADVQLLKNELPNVVDDFEVIGFAHQDFLWGINAPRIIFDKIVKRIKEN